MVENEDWNRVLYRILPSKNLPLASPKARISSVLLLTRLIAIYSKVTQLAQLARMAEKVLSTL